MKILRDKKFIVFLALSVSLLTIGRVANPPNGRTGAPGDGLCTDCHTPGNTNQDGMITVSGLPINIEASTTYTITVDVKNPNGMGTHGGFQLVALDGSDDNVGEMTNPSTSSVITTAGGRVYWEHSPAKQFGVGTMVSYTIDWTSPSAPVGEEITLYAAGNISNGSGNNSGDLIVTNTMSGELQNEILVLSIESVDIGNVSCFEGNDGFASVIAIGGTEPYEYLWTNGEITSDIDNLIAGDYEVTVTDFDGNTVDTLIHISEPNELTIDITNLESPSCFGDMNGTATAVADGGTPEYTYEWSNGETGSENTSLEGGIASVTVTDDNECTAEISFMVPEPDLLISNLTDLTDVTCAAGEDGQATIEITGGTEPYLVDWGNGRLGEVQNDLTADMYNVTITDLQGCSNTVDVEINEPSIIVIDLINKVNNQCHNDEMGSLEISGSGGTGVLEVSWSNGDQGNIADSLEIGLHFVSITDINGCVVSDSFEIGSPDAIDINLEAVQETGPNTMDGSISSEISGGTPPYTYEWSNGDTTQNIDSLSAGLYTVTVTDSLGCTAIDSILLNEISCSISSSLIITNNLCFGDMDGIICVVVDSFTSPLSFVWSDGATDSCRTDLFSGSYSVTVTDGEGCVSSVEGNITEPSDIVVVPSIMNVDCFGDSTGSITINITGGISPYEVVPSDFIEGLPSGTYTFVVTDINDCSVVLFVTVEEPDSFYIIIDDIIHVDDIFNQGEIHITVVGGTPEYEYVWTDSLGNVVSNEEDLTQMIAGEYTLTVTDSLGCTTIISAVIETRTAVIDESLSNSVSVFPNPLTSGNIHILTDIDVFISSVELIDMQGKLISRVPHDGNASISEMSIPHQEKGMYLLTLETNRGRVFKKLLIE